MSATFDYLTWLETDCKCLDVRLLTNGGGWVAIAPFLFTHAIILGSLYDYFSYNDRWCYRDYESAKKALDAWDGIGEPKGWHRHPATGRRVKEDGTIEVHF